MLALTHVDKALLLTEWHAMLPQYGQRCSCCNGVDKHNVDCEMDLALSERGFPTQAERDAARASLT